jgi:hypothetical protein
MRRSILNSLEKPQNKKQKRSLLLFLVCERDDEKFVILLGGLLSDRTGKQTGREREKSKKEGHEEKGEQKSEKKATWHSFVHSCIVFRLRASRTGVLNFVVVVSLSLSAQHTSRKNPTHPHKSHKTHTRHTT